MRVAAFFVAEEVNVSDGLYCRGGFRNVVSYVMYPTEAIAPLVIILEETPTDDPQTFGLEVDVYAQDGSRAAETYEGTVRLEARDPEAPPGLPTFALEAIPLTFMAREAGLYRIELRVDGNVASDFTFHAKTLS